MAIVVMTGGSSAAIAAALSDAAPERDIRLWPAAGRAQDIRYAVVWNPPAGALGTLPRLELIISAGAGVDGILSDPAAPQVSIARFVEADLTRRMVEYVVSQVLFHHRRGPEFLELQGRREWRQIMPPRADELRVGIMGLGVLGRACAEALAPLGYRLAGWSRSSRAVPGVRCFTGAADLAPFLAASDILVVLLPLTSETAGIIDRELIAGLSGPDRCPDMPGPVLVNAGRGGLQVEADILAALESGRLYAASLDVFETEPLPPSSPLWAHSRVFVTPHMAAESTPAAVSRYALHLIRRHERGQALDNLVDRARGY